ncbi:expressed protein, partial [Dictyostelium purpureum]
MVNIENQTRFTASIGIPEETDDFYYDDTVTCQHVDNCGVVFILKKNPRGEED